MDDKDAMEWLEAKKRSYDPSKIILNHLSCPPEIYHLKSWHFKIGDRLHCHDIIATVETDTLACDVTVFEEGVLAERFFAEGASIPDGAIIARLDLIEIAKPGGEGSAGG